MDIALQVDPTAGMTYDELLAYGRLARDTGFSAVLRADHFQLSPDEVRPSSDAWTTLAGLVRELDIDTVGTLVSPFLFRSPGLLAKLVATVAGMSKGPTVELGIGSGSHRQEHTAYGFGFPARAVRDAALREYVQIVRSLLQGEETSFSGRFYQIDRCRSVASAASVRMIIGSTGTVPAFFS